MYRFKERASHQPQRLDLELDPDPAPPARAGREVQAGQTGPGGEARVLLGLTEGDRLEHQATLPQNQAEVALLEHAHPLDRRRLAQVPRRGEAALKRF